MNWFKLIHQVATPTSLVTYDHDFGGVDEESLRSGAIVTQWPSVATLKAHRSNKSARPDDVLQSSLLVPVYSPRLQDALTSAGIRTIQFLPVTIVRPNLKPIQGFAVANVLILKPALDLDASDLEVFPSDYFLPARRGLVRSVKKAVLLAKALKGCDIVRPAEFPVTLFASERFKSAYEKHGCTGYIFGEVSVR